MMLRLEVNFYLYFVKIKKIYTLLQLRRFTYSGLFGDIKTNVFYFIYNILSWKLFSLENNLCATVTFLSKKGVRALKIPF